MALKDIENRIKEALRLAKGDKGRAGKQIIAWAMEDEELLRDLTRHHLPGIVAYHMERLQPGAPSRPAAKPKKPVSREEKFGLELLKAVAGSGGAARFGLEAPEATAGRGKASQRHVDAIRQIAAAPPARPKKKK